VSSRQVAVAPDQRSRLGDLGDAELDQVVGSPGDLGEQRPLGLQADAVHQEIVQFREDERREEQGPGIGCERLAGAIVVPLVGVERRQQAVVPGMAATSA
jgi:hypothetical protein